jgi:type I restriction enzyme S subunit
MFAVRSEPALPTDRMLTASQKYGVLFQADFMELEGRRVVEVIMGTDSLKHVEPDDFIISMRSFQGGIEWCKLRGSTSFHYVMLRPVKHVWPPYFAHLLKSPTYIQALRRTTDLIRDGQELRFSNFAQVDLPVVPLEEQKAIAIFLDRETAKIDVLVAEQEKLIALLAEKRQATISHAVTKGLDHRAPMKDSGVAWLGEVPGHWDVMTFQRCVYVQEGQVDPELEPYRSMLLIAPNHVESGTGRVLEAETAGQQAAESGKYLCKAGDVIYSKIRPALRKVCLAPEDCLCSADMYPLRGGSKLSNAFLMWFMLSEPFSALAVLESERVAMPKINRESLKAVWLPVPTRQEQIDIAAFLTEETTRLDILCAEAERAIALLKERRSALIAAAVTGQIDVRNA